MRLSGNELRLGFANRHASVITDEVGVLSAAACRTFSPGPFTRCPARFFCLGDNRDNSWDSCFTGSVPQSNIEGGGRICVYWSRYPRTHAVGWSRKGSFLRSALPPALSSPVRNQLSQVGPKPAHSFAK